MTRAIFWEVSKPAAKLEGAGDRGEAFKTLVETFGRDTHHPLAIIELGKDKVFTLRQMGPKGSIFAELADLIEANGKIRVWGRD